MMVNALCRRLGSLEAQDRVFKESSKPTTANRGKAAPPEPWAGIYSLGQRKKASLLLDAFAFCSGLKAYRSGGKEALVPFVKGAKKRILGFSLGLLASPPPAGRLEVAFSAGGFLGAGEAADRCEAQMLKTGVEMALRNSPMHVVLRAMSAYLGFSVQEQVDAWLKSQASPRRLSESDLLIPGDLPDLLAARTGDPGILFRAYRLAGPSLAAAALAGCPRETVRAMESACLNELGSLYLEEEIEASLSRLSSDELVDAQEAFRALIQSLQEESPAMAAEIQENVWENGMDKSLSEDVSLLVIELEDKLLRSVLAQADPKLIASLLQTMSPMAHDRLFSLMPPSKAKKVLQALEDSDPLGPVELVRKAQLFAQKILGELAPKGKSMGKGGAKGTGKALPLQARVRELLSAILSRD
ncbi:MAG TPA: hypothetical protein VIO60_10240 [Rectinemataceae bacterium]